MRGAWKLGEKQQQHARPNKHFYAEETPFLVINEAILSLKERNSWLENRDRSIIFVWAVDDAAQSNL